MASDAGGNERSGWRSSGSFALGATAPGPPGRERRRVSVRAACSRLILLIALATAFAPGARADTFARGSRAYAAQNYVLAAPIFQSLADQGDPRAQTYLGVMYLRGEGVPQSFDFAIRWLRVASETGFPTAQYFLGLMYDKGQGVPQDFVLAHAWLNLAVSHAEPGERRRWALIRDAVGSKMTEAQLAEARALALQWHPEPRWTAWAR